MKKSVRIGLFSAAAVFLLAAAGLLLVWWASRRVPDFYRQAVQADPALAAEASDEMIRRATSLASDVKREGRWEASFTAEQINGWLAVDLVQNHPGQLPPAISVPRVAIGPDQLKVACRYRQGYVDTVLSLEVDAYLDEPNVVALRIGKARAGALPLPLESVLKEISAAARRAGLGIRWRQADGDPVALISLPPPHDSAETAAHIDAFRLGQGDVYVAGTTGR